MWPDKPIIIGQSAYERLQSDKGEDWMRVSLIQTRVDKWIVAFKITFTFLSSDAQVTVSRAGKLRIKNNISNLQNNGNLKSQACINYARHTNVNKLISYLLSVIRGKSYIWFVDRNKCKRFFSFHHGRKYIYRIEESTCQEQRSFFSLSLEKQTRLALQCVWMILIMWFCVM